MAPPVQQDDESLRAVLQLRQAATAVVIAELEPATDPPFVIEEIGERMRWTYHYTPIDSRATKLVIGEEVVVRSRFATHPASHECTATIDDQVVDARSSVCAAATDSNQPRQGGRFLIFTGNRAWPSEDAPVLIEAAFAIDDTEMVDLHALDVLNRPLSSIAAALEAAE